MRDRNCSLRLFAVAAGFAAVLPALDARAAGVVVQSFGSMAEFQASPLYTFVMGAPGGVAEHKARSVRALRQGSSDVPASSAGAAGNTTVTSEVFAAASEVPDCLSLNLTQSFYEKMFVSLGTEVNGNVPYITLEIDPASSDAGGGFDGYDIVVFDLGKNLASGTGNGNTEATTFEVELVSEGQTFAVGSVTNTGGNYVNAILLDLTGVPGIPAIVDAVRLADVTGAGVSASGAFDLDGAVTLNPAALTSGRGSSWGRLKHLYR